MEKIPRRVTDRFRKACRQSEPFYRERHLRTSTWKNYFSTSESIRKSPAERYHQFLKVENTLLASCNLLSTRTFIWEKLPQVRPLQTLFPYKGETLEMCNFTDNNLTVCLKNLKTFLPLIKQFHIQEMILRKYKKATTKIKVSINIHVKNLQWFFTALILKHKLLKRSRKVFIMQALNSGNKQCN